jgi:RHS repeat-associated protein
MVVGLPQENHCKSSVFLPKSLPIRPTKPIFAKSVAVLYKTVLAVPVWDEENRLRLVDTNPSTKDPEGIAVYTYDAGGERAIKKVVNSGVWSVNEPNTLQTTSARKGSFTANLYPSGLLNVKVYKKLSCSGNRCVSTNVQSYTKHYYAGSQRVMSKVGSDQNIGKFDCSWLVIPFAEGGVAAEKPEETLAKADKSEAKLLKAYNITPAPDYKQNAGYAQNCISSHGIDFAAETKQAYWYHSDHLGSASYITGVDGKVCSNINYFPTGEVFVEQNLKTNVLPYKFNGKELDAETGYYYYGARYYNPKVSLWLNVDPLADYNPHMNTEHYIDGQHNGGVLNQGNGNPYIYCYQSPVKYVDPNGKQVDVTVNRNTIMMSQHLIFYGSQATTELSGRISSNVTDQFNRENLSYNLNGKNYSVKMRTTYETVSVDEATSMAENNTDNKVQFIRISDQKRSSFHNINENSGFYSTNDDLENSMTASHEGAHGMGLNHTDGSDGNKDTPPNIIRPRGGKFILPQWSINGDSKKGINPYCRTWQNELVKKVLDKVNWNRDKTSGYTGKATNKLYNHNGTERGTWDKVKDFFRKL